MNGTILFNRCRGFLVPGVFMLLGLLIPLTSFGQVDDWSRARVLRGIASGPLFPGLQHNGVIELKCGKANALGVARVSGSLQMFNGTRIKLPARQVDVRAVEPRVSWDNPALKIVFFPDNSFDSDCEYGAYFACSADLGGEYVGTWDFDFGFMPGMLGDMYIAYPFDPEPVMMQGRKWSCAKAARMQWKQCPPCRPNKPCLTCGPGSWSIDTSGGKTNISGLRLTYTPSKGTFKGSFTVYTWTNGGKKLKFQVSGCIYDGYAQYEATCKKPAFCGASGAYVRVLR